MANISVKIVGADVWVSKLKRVVMATNTITAEDALRTYPAELPNQRYVRTGKRGAATRLEAASGNNQYSKKYVLQSNPRYANGSGNPYTIGDARGAGQARVHVGRWRLIKDVVDRAVERIAAIAARRFRDILGSGPGGP
jgi:hypothetical protein